MWSIRKKDKAINTHNNWDKPKETNIETQENSTLEEQKNILLWRIEKILEKSLDDMANWVGARSKDLIIPFISSSPMLGSTIEEKWRESGTRRENGEISIKNTTKKAINKEFTSDMTDKEKDQRKAQEDMNSVIEFFSSVRRILSERYSIYDSQRRKEWKESWFEDLQDELEKIGNFLEAIQAQKLRFSNARVCLITRERIKDLLSRMRGQQWEREKNGTAQYEYKTRDHMETFQDEFIHIISFFSQWDSVTEYLYKDYLEGGLSLEEYLIALINKIFLDASLDPVMLGSKLFYQWHTMEQFSTLLEVFDCEGKNRKSEKHNTTEKLKKLKERINRFEDIFWPFKPNSDKPRLVSIFNNSNHIKAKKGREGVLRSFYENFCYSYLVSQVFWGNGDSNTTVLNKKYTISASDYMSDVSWHYDVYLTNKENQSDIIKIDFTTLWEDNDRFEVKVEKNNKRSEKVIIISLEEYKEIFHKTKVSIADYILNWKPIDLSFLWEEKNQVKEHIESKIQEQLKNSD